MTRRINIIGYEDRYEVSDDGEVRSKGFEVKYFSKKRGGGEGWKSRFQPGGILKQHTIKGGYKRIKLGNHRSYLVHRLVYCSFKGVPLDFLGQKSKTIVMHMNDDPSDNCITNLRLGTQDDNIKDCVDKGRINHKPIPLNKRKGKITYQISREIIKDYDVTGNIFVTAKKHGVSGATVSRILNGKQWA